MTYNEKKSLYESIMKEVTKTVKRQINEAQITNDLPKGFTKGFDYYKKATIRCLSDHIILDDKELKDYVSFLETLKSDKEKQQVFVDSLYEIFKNTKANRLK